LRWLPIDPIVQDNSFQKIALSERVYCIIGYLVIIIIRISIYSDQNGDDLRTAFQYSRYRINIVQDMQNTILFAFCLIYEYCMTRIRVVSSLLHPNITGFKLLDRHRHIGSSRISIITSSAILHTISIEKPFRALGYGSAFLSEMEDYVKRTHSVRDIRLLAWQPRGSYNVVEFYKKNGFDISSEHSDTYDDSSVLYDLYPMCKILPDK
jgi:GNAT superfamily N-acetyltransferase